MASYLSNLTSQQQSLHDLLISLNQSHLFEEWEQEDSTSIASFFDQIDAFHSTYPGGLTSYIEKAQDLLLRAEQGTNPFDGMSPRVPAGENLEYLSEQFLAAEQAGMEACGQAAFVLVAGGMGERLGYNGIKVALPSETTSNVTFLELYLQSIMAMQRRTPSPSELHIPLAIMTSGETHEKTLCLLEENNYFGFPKDRLFLMQQDKVPCLSDSQGTLTRDPTDKYRLTTKPHGHGDVHYLLHQTGIASKWHKEGRKWIVFFQDTNGLVFRSMCASLGVSSQRNFDSNSITGPRKAKDAMGAICKLVQQDGTSMTTNVEYNLLDPMLRASSDLYPNGDENDSETGFSPFPGNMNQLIFKLTTYVSTLDQHKGLVPEFVNPKYKDETRTSFKSPTRLECMMQDLPQQFVGDGVQVGFTSVMGGNIKFYNPVKNNIRDAAKKQKSGVDPACGASGESLMYANICQTLQKMGVHIDQPIEREWSAAAAAAAAAAADEDERGADDDSTTVRVNEWSRISLPPHLSMTTEWLREVFPEPNTVSISQRSTILVVGKGRVSLGRVKVDGALVIHVPNEKDVVALHDVVVTNQGWSLVALGASGSGASGSGASGSGASGGEQKNGEVPQSLKIRGYDVHRSEQCTISVRKDIAGESEVVKPDVTVAGGIVSGKFEGSKLVVSCA